MSTEAVRGPVAVGLKLKLIVQFDPAFTLPSQLSYSMKSPLFVPVTEMLNVNAAVPLFVKVTF